MADSLGAPGCLLCARLAQHSSSRASQGNGPRKSSISARAAVGGVQSCDAARRYWLDPGGIAETLPQQPGYGDGRRDSSKYAAAGARLDFLQEMELSARLLAGDGAVQRFPAAAAIWLSRKFSVCRGIGGFGVH